MFINNRTSLQTNITRRCVSPLHLSRSCVNAKPPLFDTLYIYEPPELLSDKLRDPFLVWTKERARGNDDRPLRGTFVGNFNIPQ